MSYSVAGVDCNLVTAYTTGADDHVTYGFNRYVAQTFTITQPLAFCIFRAKIKVPTTSYPQHYTLYNVDGAGKPTGAPITLHTLLSRLTIHDKPEAWRRAMFDDYTVIPAGTYAMVISAPTAPDVFTYYWLRDSTAPTYPGGKAWLSTDSGGSWGEVPNSDFMFEVWGWTPPPDPPPTPVLSNWAPLDYYYSSLLDGFTIVVTTDIPVHLWLRWTDIEPLKHPSTMYRRGILIQIGTRYCFVAWHENEQLEEGDTLIHTFLKRNWPICQTRWFYFIGTKQAEESPSSSPIFRLHREEEYIPSVYGPVAGSLSNRTLWYSWGAWNITHDSPTGNIAPWHDAPSLQICSGVRLTVSYFIYRGFLFFNTSGIPAGSKIISAILSLYTKSNEIEVAPPIPHINITQGVQDDPIVPANYGDQLPYTTIGGQKRQDEFIVGQYNHIAFNEAGLNWIKIGGITRLCIRQDNDVADSPPGLWSLVLCFRSNQMGDGYQPLLTIYYVPSTSPPPDWIWYEPWADTLTENNYWIPYIPAEPPTITLEDGIIKLTNPGYTDCGISVSPPGGLLPLRDPDGKALICRCNSIEATADSSSSQIHHELILRKNGQWFTIYLCLAHGGEFENENYGYIAGRPYGWTTIGVGAKALNILELFVYFSTLLGEDPDPDGWEVNVIAFALGTRSPTCTDWVKNDYLGFTYQ